MHSLPRLIFTNPARLDRTEKRFWQAFALPVKFLQASVFLFFLTMLSYSALGQQCVSVAAGNWSTAGSWSCTGATAPPGVAFTGTIVVKHNITFNASLTIPGSTTINVLNGGTLGFSGNQDLTLSNNASRINLYGANAIVSTNTGNSNIIIGSPGFTYDLPNSATALAGPQTLTNGGSIALVNSLSVTASASSTAVCVGGAASLSVVVSGGTAPYSYTWVAPAGTTLSPTSTSVVSATISTTGVKTFTVLVADNVGYTNSTTLAITGNATPLLAR